MFYSYYLLVKPAQEKDKKFSKPFLHCTCTNVPFLFLHLINSFLMLWIEQSLDDVIQEIERLQYFYERTP